MRRDVHAFFERAEQIITPIISVEGVVRARGEYLNDAHVLNLATLSWRQLVLQGAPPAPRAAHAAAALAAAADGRIS